MANQLSNRVIYIDSTMGSSFRTIMGNAATNGVLRIGGLKLLGGSAAATAIVTDPVSGKVLVNMQAGAGLNDFTNFSRGMVWRDFIVTITGAGAILNIFTV